METQRKHDMIDGFAVDIRSDDDATAAKIYKRAQQLGAKQ
jgi:hypothetical protein